MKKLKLYSLFFALAVVLSACNSDVPQSISSRVTQDIVLDEGWCMWSTYINTSDSILDLFDGILESVELINEDSITTYCPSLGINDIGLHEIGKSYQIYMTSAQTLSITGWRANPGEYPIILEEGWSYLGYLLDYPIDVELALESISNYIIIIKDDRGNMFWPEIDYNGIGYMEPGEGYMIRMNTKCMFIYPTNHQ